MSDSFGVRNGIVKPREAFQLTEMDKKLRTDLFNTYLIYVFNCREGIFRHQLNQAYQILFIRFFVLPLDRYNNVDDTNRYQIRPLFFDLDWYKVYDFLESLITYLNQVGYDKTRNLIEGIQNDLEDNKSGYYLHDSKFIPITTKVEVDEISELENQTLKYGLKEIKTHLDTALTCLSQKPKPDLRNSIKESISMVGAIARRIEPSNDLSKALHKISESSTINKQLIEGFKKLYHFTSGEGGIRHELMEDVNLDLETARYFLVSCSAFTNFLISEALKRGIIK